MRTEPLFRTCRDEISAYCASHGLSYAKLRKCGISGSDKRNIFQYWDRSSEERQKGLMNNTPAPIVLTVERTKDGLQFTETEYTNLYLAE